MKMIIRTHATMQSFIGGGTTNRQDVDSILYCSRSQPFESVMFEPVFTGDDVNDDFFASLLQTGGAR